MNEKSQPKLKIIYINNSIKKGISTLKGNATQTDVDHLLFLEIADENFESIIKSTN